MVIIARIGEFVKRHTETFWRIFVMLCIAWSAYNIGLIEAHRGAQHAQSSQLIQTRESIVSQTQSRAGERALIDRSDLRVVTSKTTSTKKYHYSWCASGKRIKAANQQWFPTEDDARRAGYTLAGNCLP